MTKVTAIIPSLANDTTKHHLKLCVESLRETTDWDIIVVTNGGKDQNPLFDVDIFGISKHIHTRQQGQCNAVNIGAQVAESNTDYFFICNDDMYFAPGWLNDVGQDAEWPLVWSPNLVEPENNPGSADPFLKLDAGFTLDEFKPEVVNKFVKLHEDNNEEPGFNLPFFIRADVWRTIEGYDAKYDPWGSNSDTDLQTKINLAGITPMRLRDVVVYHFSNKSGTFDGTHQEEWRKNFDYYRVKWGYTRDDEPKADVWYNTNMVLPDKLVYHPEWKGKYESADNR